MRLPTLDCEMFMEKKTNKINYSFFEKKMKTPFCVMKESAMSEKSKVSILSQDLIRRMQNTSEKVPESERIKIIDNYIDRLLVSGYKTEQIKEIVESGLKGYIRKLNRAIKSGIPLHRPAASTLQGRIRKKLTERSNWYKKKPKNSKDNLRKASNKNISKPSSSKIISVMFVQKTPQSLLANRLKAADKKISEITGDKLRIVERAGLKLSSLLHRSDPWAGQKCSDQQCLICTNPHNKKFDCSKRNIVYKSVCLTCKDENDNDNEKVYFGESHVSGRERSKQHNFDFQKKKDDSHQYKHYTEAHAHLDMREVKFGVTVLKQFFSSFSRQHYEAILIFKHSDNLNSKAMYNRSKIPRLQVMLQEAQEHMKVYDEVELSEEIVKLKQKHFREPLVEDNPPPSKKLKRWHNLKGMKRKKTKPIENLEPFETREENVTAQANENASQNHDNAKDDDKDIRKINPFPVFVFKATTKNVKVEHKTSVTKASKSRGKGTTSNQKNNIFNYFTMSRGSQSIQTGFNADHI